MVRVAMFDLGLTLIDADRKPFPHVREALTAISHFTTTGGKPVLSCLVSDVAMPVPLTPAKVNASFNEYLEILDKTGLRPFFEPVKKRVTLSTHAGVRKPDRRIFEWALKRLGVKVELGDCVFMTEDPAHIRAARKTLGMHTLQFRPTGGEPGFNDWAQAPGMVARLVDPRHLANAEMAVKAHLAAVHDVEMESAQPSSTATTMKITAKAWRSVSVPGFEDLGEVLVPVPVEGQVTRDPAGRVESVDLRQPSAEEISEAASFVKSLAAHGQIQGYSKDSRPSATHRIEIDASGRRKLVRRGFSAV